MPENSGMAFIVIQHLSPDYKSMMVELLSKHTKMKVLRAEDGIEVEPNSVYLIPPRKNLKIFRGRLILSEQDFSRGVNLPIDVFFQSLSEDQAEKAIAIVLSGTGSDGTRGIRLIKQNGGVVFVQSVESSRFDGMPRSAISTGLADFILPPEEMPSRLLNLQKRPELPAPHTIDAGKYRSSELERLFAIVYEAAKVDFTYYKPSTILRRIERRMTFNQVNDLEEYLVLLRQNPSEVQSLYREFLIGVTSFFRDREVFEELERKYLPELFADKKELRFWVTGCSTGEEVYSLAILSKETMETIGRNIPIKIFATDIDRNALMIGGAGRYPENIVADVPPRFLNKYFHYVDGKYQVDRSLREIVIFAQHNLVKDPPFTNLDLISCRNLLIYLQPALQEKSISLFNFALKPNGLLVLGASESVTGSEDLFEPLNIRYKIYKNRSVKRPIASSKTDRLDVFTLNLVNEVSYSRRGYDAAEPQEKLLEQFLHAIAADFLPITIFVNHKMEAFHIFGDATPYLRIPSGKMTNDISHLAIKELSIPFATGIQKAFKSQTAIKYKGIAIKIGGQKTPIDLTFLPIKTKPNQDPFVAVMIEKKETDPSQTALKVSSTEFTLTEAAEQRIRDLENELQFTRENLQATIEELETANEELQAANEELMASNQELQSANEELQSVNEELHTVNTEYYNKIVELTQLNNDLNNLIKTANPIILFFDENLELRRFTPESRAVFNPGELEMGRPIGKLSSPLKEISLEEMAHFVQETNQTVEKEVILPDRRAYLLKVSPYCIEKNLCVGVIVSLTDISSLRYAEATLANREADLTALYENAPIGIAVIKEGTILRSSRYLSALSSYTLEELEGMPVRSLFEIGDDAIRKLEHPNAETAFETFLAAKNGDRLPVFLKIVHLPEEGNGDRFLIAVIDISPLKKAERNAQLNQKRYSLLFNSMTEGVVFQDRNGQITDANSAAQHILGLTLDEMLGRTSMDPRWQASDANGNPLPGERHPSMISLRTGQPVRNFIMRVFNPKIEGYRFISINAMPLLEEGEVNEVYTIFEDITHEMEGIDYEKRGD